MQGGRWWTRLSDSELRARLEQRDVPPDDVDFMVACRDDVPQSIYEVLGDE
jgi:hypothetical protein